METLPLSAKTLGELVMPKFCPRCYWLRLHTKGKLPFRGGFPGIFISIDVYSKGIVHDYFDEHKRLPAWYPDVGPVKSYVSEKELHWRKFSFTDSITGLKLWGSPDEILQLEDGSFHIVDYKTARITAAQDDLAPLYEVQLNAYAYICAKERTELAPISSLSLIYTEPQTHLRASVAPEVMLSSGFALHFSATLRSVELQPEKMIPPLLKRARAIYDQQPAPKPRAGCEDCDNFARVLNLAPW